MKKLFKVLALLLVLLYAGFEHNRANKSYQALGVERDKREHQELKVIVLQGIIKLKDSEIREYKEAVAPLLTFAANNQEAIWGKPVISSNEVTLGQYPDYWGPLQVNIALRLCRWAKPNSAFECSWHKYEDYAPIAVIQPKHWHLVEIR